MSILFLLIATVLTIGVTLLLVLPLLRPPSKTDAREADKRLAVYRQQLAELEQDRAAGIITQEQYQQSRQELERRVLEETTTASVEAAPCQRSPSSRTVALALIVVIPIAGFLLYWMLGNPLALLHADVQVKAMGGQQEFDHQTSSGLDALTDRLKQRMEQNPDNGTGWALLARAYVELGRHSEAVTAFEKAVALIPDDAQLLVDYADALAMAQGRRLEGKPEALITRALTLDPRNVKGLMLAGTIAYDRKDFPTALKQWEQARQGLPPETEPELIQELASSINEVRGLLGLAAAPGPAKGPKEAARPVASVSSSNTSPAITGTITIAPKLAGKSSPTDTLYVFARTVEGPPMPVAIVRTTNHNLPFTFRLDDSNSPMPTRKLSDAGSVVIVARLSKSGEAMPKSGDLQGMSRPVKPGTQDLKIAIDSELP
ncbi:MAG TPA: c-type cytochrome biogenesis protein CcmI [Nitrospira sp.]|nr:c-type cytochrome biogenesis protein CcmI [Nitrospira sp.]